MTIEDRASDKNEPPKNLFEDWFKREDDPDYGKKYRNGTLRILALGLLLYGYFSCDEKMYENKAKELPEKIITFEEILNNPQVKEFIRAKYIPNNDIRRYAKEIEIDFERKRITTPYENY